MGSTVTTRFYGWQRGPYAPLSPIKNMVFQYSGKTLRWPKFLQARMQESGILTVICILSGYPVRHHITYLFFLLHDFFP